MFMLMYSDTYVLRNVHLVLRRGGELKSAVGTPDITVCIIKYSNEN